MELVLTQPAISEVVEVTGDLDCIKEDPFNGALISFPKLKSTEVKKLIASTRAATLVVETNLLLRLTFYSHSIVPGGLLVMSSVTLFTSRTSFVIRVEIFSSTSYGNLLQSAVIASSLDTGRRTIG